MQTRLLSLVVPCYNEAPNLPELYRQCCAAFTPSESLQDFELILVNDGSTDDTLAAARELAAADARVRVISFSRNFGKEAAMNAGLTKAVGDAVIIMDSDLQHPPELIGELIAGYEEGYHQVIAVRDRSGDPKIRSWFSRRYYSLFSKILKVRLQDGAGDFRLLSRRAVDALLSMPEYNRFSKGMYSWIGMRTKRVYYRNHPRFAGKTTWSFRGLFNYGLGGLVSFNERPLRTAIKVGLAAFTLFIFYLIWLLIRIMLYGIDTPGYLTTIAVIVGVGGIQLIFLGVLGEYIGRIYSEVKRRPLYIIEEEINPAAKPEA